MKSSLYSVAAASLLLFPQLACAGPTKHKSNGPAKQKPNGSGGQKSNGQKSDANATLSSYDYIVVGGGPSGLTVANRLSAQPGISVLVIEAGPLDQREDSIQVPGLAGTAAGTIYDWNASYVANPALQGRTVPLIQGHGVGGGTLLNRLIMGRGSSADYDRWGSFAAGWDWNGLFPFFKKSENWIAATPNIAREWNITDNPAYHGVGGPILSTHSPFVWPTLKNYILGNRQLGAKTPADQDGGDAVGVFSILHAQNPKDASRVSGRTAYYDPVAGRGNLKLLTNTLVTKLTSKGNTITGVEIATGPGAPRSTIIANKEVIMAAGPIRTPHVMKLSGIGDPAELERFNISVVGNNSAVGQNLQDHVALAFVYAITAPLTTANLSDPTFAAQALAQWRQNASGPYSTATGDYLTFLPASLIDPDNYTALASSLNSQDPGAYLDASASPAVRAGYAIEKNLLSKGYTSANEATVEVIWADGVVVTGLQHPASRGTVKLASADPFTAPLADAAFLKNPVDMQVMVATTKYVRRLMATAPLKTLSPIPIAPAANVTTDEQIMDFIRGSASTLWHPVGSCRIGTAAQGGCVDVHLKVFGVNNLRVVDASTMPMSPAAHTQSTVYAVAEKAANIILSGF